MVFQKLFWTELCVVFRSSRDSQLWGICYEHTLYIYIIYMCASFQDRSLTGNIEDHIHQAPRPSTDVRAPNINILMARLSCANAHETSNDSNPTCFSTWFHIWFHNNLCKLVAAISGKFGFAVYDIYHIRHRFMFSSFPHWTLQS